MLATRTYAAVLTFCLLLLTAAALSPTPSTSAAWHDDARGAVPDGHIVATAFRRGPLDYVVSMLPDGSDRQRIVRIPKDAEVRGIDVSDDGSQVALAFEPGSGIFTVSSDGSDFEQVTRRRGDNGPTFSPTGARIAFSRDHFRDFTSTLMSIKADGSNLTTLTSGAEPQPYSPSWSPDGKYIAFVWVSDDFRKQSIVLADPTGTWFRFIRTTRRVRGNFHALNWSPDSSKIIYSRNSQDHNNVDLWTVDWDGSNVTRITDTPNRLEDHPAYSPDGSAIACSLSPSKNYDWADVMVMDADGGNRQRIDTPNAWEYQVAWGD